MQKNCLNYPVEIVPGAFGESENLAEILKQVSNGEVPRVLLLADNNVVQRMPTLGTKIGAYFQRHGIQLAGAPILMVGGERVKGDNLRFLLKVLGALQEGKVGQRDIVLILGGGTILDVGNFAASIFRGGIPVVRMPTTPAAMFSAAFAEKAAVDSSKSKDILCVKSEPAAVVIDPELAETVNDAVWQTGFAEVFRLSLALDATSFEKVMLAANDYREKKSSCLLKFLEGTVALRKKKGDTNFAVPLAHRLEEMSGFKLPHGYAVVLAVCLDVAYAVECGRLPAETRDRVVATFEALGTLECMQHSRYLLAKPAYILEGLDELLLSGETIDLLAAPGKVVKAKTRDVDAFAKAAEFLFSHPVPA